MASTVRSFKSWCQRDGAKGNQEALQSSGEARNRFMMDYLVMNARHKKARVEAVSQRSVVHHKKNKSGVVGNRTRTMRARWGRTS